jgi:hypothetical protein
MLRIAVDLLWVLPLRSEGSRSHERHDERSNGDPANAEDDLQTSENDDERRADDEHKPDLAMPKLRTERLLVGLQEARQHLTVGIIET